MNKRIWVPAGFLAVGILGCMLIPKTPPPQTVVQAIAEMALPDLDTDGQPERLQVMPTDKPNLILVRLASSNGSRTHDMIAIPASGGLTFEKRENSWALLADGNHEIATMKLYQPQTSKVPDLILLAGNDGLRYTWVERGFLKLNAHELIAGFSAGLIMMNDHVGALEAIGGPVQADGTWNIPLSKPIPLKVLFNDNQRVSRITFESNALLSRQGFHVGSTVGEFDKIVQGKRESNYWMSPRYGLIGHLGTDQKVEAISIVAPWKDSGEKKAPAAPVQDYHAPKAGP